MVIKWMEFDPSCVSWYVFKIFWYFWSGRFIITRKSWRHIYSLLIVLNRLWTNDCVECVIEIPPFLKGWHCMCLERKLNRLNARKMQSINNFSLSSSSRDVSSRFCWRQSSTSSASTVTASVNLLHARYVTYN